MAQKRWFTVPQCKFTHKSASSSCLAAQYKPEIFTPKFRKDASTKHVKKDDQGEDTDRRRQRLDEHVGGRVRHVGERQATVEKCGSHEDEIRLDYAVMPGFHHSVAVSPFQLAVAVSVHRCRCRCVSFYAVYGCNGTEFSYVIFTEQRQNGETATEWWKPGIIQRLNTVEDECRRLHGHRSRLFARR